MFCLPKHSLSLQEKITHGGLNPGGKSGREGVVSECAGPSVSVPASHGELPDKPVILTGQISAEKPSTPRGFAQLIRQSHLQISSSTLLPLTPGGCTPASCAPRPRVGHHTRYVQIGLAAGSPRDTHASTILYRNGHIGTVSNDDTVGALQSIPFPYHELFTLK